MPLPMLPEAPEAQAGHRAHTPPGMDCLILHPCLIVQHQRCSSHMAIIPLDLLPLPEPHAAFWTPPQSWLHLNSIASLQEPLEEATQQAHW